MPQNGSIYIRIVVPALARTVCARAVSLSLFIDDTAIASQLLPPPGADPFHVAFALDVASVRPGEHELLAQFADVDGVLVGLPAAVDVTVRPELEVHHRVFMLFTIAPPTKRRERRNFVKFGVIIILFCFLS